MMLPAVSIGTSVFIGAGQFGARSRDYYLHFYLQPENMVKIIIKAIEEGVPSVQVIGDKKIIEAVKEAEKESGVRLALTVTVGMVDWQRELHLALSLEPVVVFVHAQITDTLNLSLLERIVDEIRKGGPVAGCATHNPHKSIEFLDNTGLEIGAYLAPLNKLGHFMGDDPKRALSTIQKTPKVVIAKKVLAAGRIEPEEAFSYIKSIPKVLGMAVGVASLEEVKSTLRTAKRHYYAS